MGLALAHGLTGGLMAKLLVPEITPVGEEDTFAVQTVTGIGGRAHRTPKKIQLCGRARAG
ncbi:MAG: hypothetical protein Q7O66_20880 [Dehalococcoidia bacterium]|nr:hypothetical protein [Dehalococcoidia bacterium]